MIKDTFEVKQKIIYIADDDRAIVDAMSFMLADAGYKVESAYDEKVIEMILKKSPDLLILDIWMSGTNGGEICKKLKNNKLTKNIPIIMISANPDTKHISKKCGANDYVSKPFDVNELLFKIQNTIAPMTTPLVG